MKEKEKRIQQLSDADIRFLAKKHRQQLIMPGPKVKKAVLAKIDESMQAGKSRILPFPIPRFLGYGIAALLAIILGTGIGILLTYQKTRLPYITMVSGYTNVITGNRKSPLSAGTVLEREFILDTDVDSTLHFQDGKQALFRLTEESRVHVEKASKKEVSLFLEKGVILAKTYQKGHKKEYKVHTQNAIIRFLSVVCIGYNDGVTHVALKEGSAYVRPLYGGTSGEITLSPGESISLDGDGQFDIKPFLKDDEKQFRSLTQATLFPETEETSSVTISTGLEQVTLLVDGNIVQQFSREVSMLFAPGDYLISLTKEGYTPYRSDINLESGMDMKMNVVLEKSQPEKNSGLHEEYIRTGTVKILMNL